MLATAAGMPGGAGMAGAFGPSEGTPLRPKSLPWSPSDKKKSSGSKPTKDPVMQHGARKISNAMKERARHMLDIALSQDRLDQLAITVPPVMFFVMTILVVEVLYIYWAVWMFLYLMIAIGANAYTTRSGKLDWQKTSAKFSLVGITLGLILGIALFYSEFVYYYRYRDLRRHTNVFGTQPADSMADAGMIEFSKGSVVDQTRSVGYQSIGLGEKICVAPVVDSATTAIDTISFFAVGVDCCEFRGQFRCGDVGDPAAKFGMLLLDPGTVTASPMLEWLVDDPALREAFTEAIALQKAVFGTPVAERTRLLLWTSDPIGLQNGYWWTGCWRIFFWTLLWSGACYAAAHFYLHDPLHLLGQKNSNLARLPTSHDDMLKQHMPNSGMSAKKPAPSPAKPSVTTLPASQAMA